MMLQDVCAPMIESMSRCRLSRCSDASNAPTPAIMGRRGAGAIGGEALKASLAS